MGDETQELDQLREEVARLSSRVQDLEAGYAVRETLLDYAHFHDRGLSDELAELFTEDAVLDISGFGAGLDTSITGREAIREMYAQIDARSDGPPPYKHAITNLRIEVDGDQAVTSSYLMDWGGAATDRGPGGGMYRERLERQIDGRWLIKHKRIASTAELTVDAVSSLQI
ncbi:MAG: nuclear transport factor 2 family protein [Gammaproteobacteria bacterium]|jgi:ketosteroid isomerase-like protein|nr:nuclear transport factor 2 family protein [Gammaproteobacteria bacterium]MBT5684055.1 nuclear transport factor 2 family protein [Gammaproteobacteria bacterium]MBT5725312.1 nuclear transport factor 2 family protein [Gammaproteobacteria bacterium]